jgi:hypothetical protein
MKLPDHITNVYFSTIPWYSLSMWILEHEKPLDEICEDDKTYEFFNIDKDVNTSTYIIHNFRINYQNKPNDFLKNSPYEFASIYFKVHSMQYHQFWESHPQKHTYTLHKYNIPLHSNYTRL